MHEAYAIVHGIKPAKKSETYLECTPISPHNGKFPDKLAEAKRKIANDQKQPQTLFGTTKSGPMDMAMMAKLLGV